MKAATAYPMVQVVVGARKDFLEQAPQVHDFLRRYHTTGALVSEALAYMQQTKGTRRRCRAPVPAEARGAMAGLGAGGGGGGV